jgi:3-dehydroquinate synthase
MGSANVVLTGFSGTGKTTVGRALAARLERPFVDVDAEIVARAGCTIPEIFAGRGEAAFRALEAEVCRELAKQAGTVIATGGGALVDPANRAALEESGTVVCLTCDVDEIVQRTDGAVNRPLLGPSANRRAAIEGLLSDRAEAYAAMRHHVDTTRRSKAEVVDAIVDLLGEVILPVRHASGTYDVRIGLGGLGRLGDALRAAGFERSAAVALVTNPTVHSHHGAAALDALRAAGFRPELFLVPDGEPYKRLGTVEQLYDGLVDAGLDRRGVVVGLGGGVTTDIAGFAAATYLRGVRLVLVPTSLLAMVDASVGGKTAVDLPRGKNLVGAFWQPELVVVDPRLLRTLPEAELRSGLAEAMKHGLLGDPELFEELSRRIDGFDSWWSDGAVERLARAVRVKIAVVEEDPCERGVRATLNLGHTVGHAIEATSDYTIRHGEAVSIGMVAASRLAAALGERPIVDAVEAALARWGLPTRCPDIEIDRLLEMMGRDKKRGAAGLRWILPRAIGTSAIVDGVPEEAVRRVLAEMGARSEP